MSEVAAGSEVALQAAPPARAGLAGLIDRLVSGLAVIAGFLAGGMMLLTVADVAGRGLLNRPLVGAFEVTELAMAAIVFLGLPLVTWRREHVGVTLFYERMSPRVQSLSTALGEIVAALVCGLLAWRAWAYAERLLGVGERTMELGVPRGLVPAGVALALALTAALFLLLASRALLYGERAAS